MTIQFNLPKNHVKEWVISYLLNKLLSFHDLDKSIFRAEVNLKEDSTGVKRCDISISIPGDSL